MTWLLLLSVCMARGPSGLATPALGGGLASPVRPGPVGLPTNPANARVARTSMALDLSAAYSAMSYTLDQTDPTGDDGTSVVPYLGFATPAGPFGFGLALMAPIGRTGGGGDEDWSEAPGRFHSIDGGTRVLEADLCVAAAPLRRLTLGASLRGASATLGTFRSVDTGATLAGIVDGELGEDLVGDPFLEGTQDVRDAKGTTLGWSAGALYRPGPGWVISSWYRSPLHIRATGDVHYVPANSLNLEITGQIENKVSYPPEAGLALQIPVGKVRLVPELGWVGWSSFYRIESQLTGLSAGSEDQVFNNILLSMGTTLDDLLAGQDQVVTTTGMKDVWSPGLAVQADLAEGWVLHTGVWYSPASVPDWAVHPSNLDFATTDLRWGVEWAAGKRTRLALVGDSYLTTERKVGDSANSLLNDGATGLNVPSGNGEYKLTLMRGGLTWVQDFGRRRVTTK